MQVVDALPEHLEQFLKKPIRQQDVDEWVWLGNGRKVADTLKQWALEDYARACLNEAGECIALWGARGQICWLIATEEAQSRARSIHRLWLGEFARLLATRPNVYLYAVTLGTGDQKWHRVLGFEVAEHAYYPFTDVVHHTIYKREPQWAN